MGKIKKTGRFFSVIFRHDSPPFGSILVMAAVVLLGNFLGGSLALAVTRITLRPGTSLSPVPLADPLPPEPMSANEEEEEVTAPNGSGVSGQKNPGTNPWEGRKKENGADVTVVVGQTLADYRTGSGDGLLAIQKTDGAILTFRAGDILEKVDDDLPFTPIPQKELAETLLAEMEGMFRVESSDHFLIVYNTSLAYAQWHAKLFESRYDGLEKAQLRLGLSLPPPEFPLVVLLFSDRAEFLDYAQRDIPDPSGIAAYYNRLDNRVVLYDLSESESAAMGENPRLKSSRQIEEFLSRPNSAFNVATLIHEATHQILFNRSMILRTGPYPLWLAEGIAMYFETPDGRSNQGWSPRGAMRTNTFRLAHLREYLATTPDDPVRTLIGEEDFREQLLASYAMSWGLFHYLHTKEPKKLAEYIQRVATKVPYAVYSPQERLADFESVFGSDWEKFHKNFGRFLAGLK